MCDAAAAVVAVGGGRSRRGSRDESQVLGQSTSRSRRGSREVSPIGLSKLGQEQQPPAPAPFSPMENGRHGEGSKARSRSSLTMAIERLTVVGQFEVRRVADSPAPRPLTPRYNKNDASCCFGGFVRYFLLVVPSGVPSPCPRRGPNAVISLVTSSLFHSLDGGGGEAVPRHARVP